MSPSLDEELSPQFDERVTVESAQKGDTDALGILYRDCADSIKAFLNPEDSTS